MDSSSLPQLIPLLQILLASPSPLTLGATLTAFVEICPDRLDLLHPYYRHIVRLLVDADEWGQIVALEVLTIYARSMLDKPDNSGAIDPSSVPAPQTRTKPSDLDSDDDDEFQGIDTDLAMFLHLSKPLFQSRNPAVILGMANAYYHLAPASGIVGQQLLVPSLLHLAGSSHVSGRGEEISALAWDVIVSMVEERKVSSWTLLGNSFRADEPVAICFLPNSLLSPRIRFCSGKGRETKGNDGSGIGCQCSRVHEGVQGMFLSHGRC